MTDSMELVWITSPEHRDSTARALTEAGAELKKRAGFEPITTLLVVAAVGAVASALRSLYADARYRGVLIDMTKSPVEVREMPGWDRNQVLVITAAGPQFHQFADDDHLDKLLASLKR
ncbi:hypothetical protein [Nocardia yamanashiensis]|uniref:hypothetical protein n=1 Tax=Nocardia yamanashiensis TaxID=209247 RepID=UPI00082C26FF|nr:hypothetical protein [Nocardia yamanashiensis]